MTVARDTGAFDASVNECASIVPNIESYVSKLGGNRVIKRVLVANNGIAAVKVIRSIRKWAYATFGNDREVGLIRKIFFVYFPPILFYVFPLPSTWDQICKDTI